MIERLLEFSVRQRALVLVLAAVFVTLGVVAAVRVPIDAVPDVTNVQVQVITAAPALGPVDVETYVTFPIEYAMAGLPHVEEIRSTSRAGISVVTVVFSDDVDLYFARQIVGERLTDARGRIPAGYGEPQLGPVSSGLGEIYHFEVRGDGHQSLMDLRAVLDWQIAPRLQMVPGIVAVNAFGGEARTMQITLDPQRLVAAQVGVPEVLAAIDRNHGASGGAYIVDGPENITVRADARVRTPEELGSIVVQTWPDRAPLYLRDLGAVGFAARVRFGAVTRDGRGETVVGVAMMLLGANSGQVAARVRETLDDVSRSLPPGVRIETYYDRSELVHRTIHTVGTNLLEASALVVFVLFLTLATLRTGSLVAVAIPLALLGAFIGMWLAGISGNLLSLGALDFGLLVDGAIIIVENAQRHLAEKRAELGRPLTDAERQDVVLAAAREVRGATAFGEAIIALVYVPLLALEGVEGRMFRPMALTVLFALATAFVLSLTVVPALASMVLSRDARDDPSRLISLAQRAYRPSLAAALRWPRVTFGLALLALAGGVLIASRLGREFLPQLDEGAIVMPTVRLPSVSLEHSVERATRIERVLHTFPEVRTVISRTGRAEIAIDPMGINMTDVYVMLNPRAGWRTAHDREGLVAAFDHALGEQVPGVGFAYSQPIEMNTSDLLAGISSDLALHIYGSDMAQLQQLADRAVHVLRAIPGARDVRAEMIAGMNSLNVRVDRAALARYGVDARAVLDTVSALGGVQAGMVIDGTQRYPITARLGPEARRSLETVSALPVRTPAGVVVPLGQLAHVTLDPAPSQISRERLSRRVTVQLNVRGRDLGSFAEAARAAVDRGVRLPVGYSFAWAGEYERLQSATLRLAVIVPITLALILVLLIATFGALRPALLIFSNVPIAISGGVAALALRGMPLSVSAAVGFIALFGVAVLNGLVLMSAMERLRATGMALAQAVSQACESRLRPVLTTAMVASLGFLPMAVATGAGAEVQRPVATVVIGGLVSSTLLTLLVLPAVYELFTRPLPASAAAGSAGEGSADKSAG